MLHDTQSVLGTGVLGETFKQLCQFEYVCHSVAQAGIDQRPLSEREIVNHLKSFDIDQDLATQRLIDSMYASCVGSSNIFRLEKFCLAHEFCFEVRRPEVTPHACWCILDETARDFLGRADKLS